MMTVMRMLMAVLSVANVLAATGTFGVPRFIGMNWFAAGFCAAGVLWSIRR